MEVLPDIVGPEPTIVFCGLAGAASTKLRDHYDETPGNSFWESLHLSGLSPRRLRPDEDVQVTELGFGLTDMVGHWDPRWVEIDELVAQLERWQPEWLAFTSKGVAHEAARALGVRRLGDGRPHRLAWWRDLAALSGVGADPAG